MNFFKKLMVAMTCFLTLSVSAHAKGPLEIIVPFGAGGLTDNLARYAGRALQENGVENIVINKPGAAGTIGVRHARDNNNAAGTILMLAGGPGLIAPYTQIPQPYDIARDFQPIALIASDIMTVSVPVNSPYRTLPELIAAIKKDPEKLTWGHASDINRISGKMFLQKIQGSATAIPFNGGQQALTALVGEHVNFTLSGVADVKSMADSGRVRILAVADDKRHPKLSGVPTFKELGVDFQHGSFYAFYASKNTPSDVIDKFNSIAVARMKSDKNYEFLHDILVPNFLGPRELARWYDNQVRVWRPIIEANRPK